MNNNRNTDKNDYLAVLFAVLLAILLTLVYFLVEANVKDISWKNFLQSVSGNIIATTLSFSVVYIFITRFNALGDSKNDYQRIYNQIDLVIDQLKSDIFPRIESKLDLGKNSSFDEKFDLLKSDLALQIQQISKEIGNQVNTKLNLDSNELYRFYGLQGVRTGMIFQNFRVSRASDIKNTNAVSHLWADSLYGNSLMVKIISNKPNEPDPFLTIDFQSFENSFGCNVTIRPQDQKAIDRKNQDLNYLYFSARIPKEVLHDADFLRDIGIAIRIVNGKYQHWDYASRAGEYIQQKVNEDGTWTEIYIDLNDKTRWSHFSGDGNQYINENERNNADLSIISALTLKVGKFKGDSRSELGYGKGRVDIKNVRFEPDMV